MKRLSVRHRTDYAYDQRVVLQPHMLRLRPRESFDLDLNSFAIASDRSHTVSWSRDVFDNAVATLEFDLTPVNSVSIEAVFEVSRRTPPPMNIRIDPSAALYPFAYGPEERDILAPYFANTDAENLAAARQWADRVWIGQEVDTAALLHDLCMAAHRAIQPNLRYEEGVQSAAETLRLGSGACRDIATLYMEAARSLGLAARFVSGYLYDAALPDYAAATHAWAQIYLPGAGWRGFDPTAGRETDAHHIPVAVSRNPQFVPPLTGSFIGAGGSSMWISVEIKELE